LVTIPFVGSKNFGVTADHPPRPKSVILKTPCGVGKLFLNFAKTVGSTGR